MEMIFNQTEVLSNCYQFSYRIFLGFKSAQLSTAVKAKNPFKAMSRFESCLACKTKV
jgi:hypothetical protein